VCVCVCLQIFGPFFLKKLIKFQVIKCAFVNGWGVFFICFGFVDSLPLPK